MADAAQAACALARDVRDVLTGLGDALVTHDLDRILAAEPRLADVTSALQRLSQGGPLPPAARTDLAAARLALRRCQRLGDTLDVFLTTTLVAQGRGPEYASHGRPSAAAARPGLTARG